MRDCWATLPGRATALPDRFCCWGGSATLPGSATALGRRDAWASSGRLATNVWLHFGQRMVTPVGGTRLSSTE
jgi:hypothetical protein